MGTFGEAELTDWNSPDGVGFEKSSRVPLVKTTP